MGRGGAILTPNKLVLTFVGLHVFVQFGENRRRNATMRVSTDGQTHTHTHTHAQTQNDFIICPMLYAIAMGQIISRFVLFSTVNIAFESIVTISYCFNRIFISFAFNFFLDTKWTFSRRPLL